MVHSLRYEFTQKFDFPADAAFRWCTDYQPGDLGLMGDDGARSIERISKDTFILQDTYRVGRKTIRKKKVVNLYPDTLSWVSTHLIGKMKYSQFQYRISSNGGSKSQLYFTGLQVEYDDKKRSHAPKISEQLKEEDSHAWELLAKEMEKDLRRVRK
ncbi:MAG: hypothetical protein OK457_01420 [Thaumarchaeota archaeon]|nr:hypothetical protein [Nitrososphaerota archaeon]